MENYSPVILEKVLHYTTKLMKNSLFCIMVIVIAFFKAFIVNWYEPPTVFPLSAFLLMALVIYIAYLLRRKINGDELIYECIFIFTSILIGIISWWISNLLKPLPDMTAYISLIENTTRFGWLKVMFGWDTFAYSAYFIAHFVALVYFHINVLLGMIYIIYLKDEYFDLRQITKRWLTTFVMIPMGSSMFFHLMTRIISLLQ